jgi:DNA invertase Pin-like site-specific DNA recombinase
VTKTALYCRISRDDAGDMLGVQRQERECRALAKAKGWSVGAVLTDDDISAFNGAARAGYAELLDGLRADRFDAVIAYKLDRLTREGLRGLTPLLEALDGKPLACVHDHIDTSTAMGEGMAGMLASMGRAESENIGTRMRSKKDELAVSGKRAGGSRPFGYDAPPGEPMTIRADEAEALRAAASAVLAGESLTEIARTWNAQEIKPPQSKKGTWTATQIRSVLSNPLHAALRVHRGEVVGPAEWPPVLDRATHERLVSLLTDPARKRRTPSSRSLLTGIVYCECGGPMTRDVNNGKRVLRCRRGPGLPGCGSVSIVSEPVETMVSEYVIGRLDATTAVADAHVDLHTGDRDAAAGTLEELEQRLTDVGEMFAAGDITRGEFTRMRASLHAKIKDARRQLRPARARHALDAITSKIGDVWDDLSRDRKREIIAAVVERVTVAPATRRRGFDPDRITIT